MAPADEGGAEDFHPVMDLGPILFVAVFRIDSPGWVIRQAGQNSHIVPLFHQFLRDFGDAEVFRPIMLASDQYLHDEIVAPHYYGGLSEKENMQFRI